MKLSAGLVDAGASSLATFVAAVAATRLLSDAEIGAYALVFGAWALATQLPGQLVFAPAEAVMVRFDPIQRLAHLRFNLRFAFPWAVAASMLVAMVVFVLPPDVPRASGLHLALTGAAAAALAPAQEHARQLLHLAGRHWVAAWVSVARFVLVAALLAAAIWSGTAPALAPLGALALADALCLVAVVVIAGKSSEQPRVYDGPGLVRIGAWLLASALAAPAAGFLVNFVLARSVSSATLGLAEQARIAAQPILVLGVGLSAVLRPTSMKAAVEQDRSTANAINRKFHVFLWVFTALYLATSLAPGSVNVVRLVVPGAFGEVGLMQVSVLAASVNALVMLRRSEVIALTRTREVAAVEAWSAVSRLPVAVLARAMQSWVVPVAFLVSGLVRVVGFRRVPLEPRRGGKGQS